jgi:hypothetical protein
MDYQYEINKKQEQIANLKGLLKSDNNRHIIVGHEQELQELWQKWIQEQEQNDSLSE